MRVFLSLRWYFAFLLVSWIALWGVNKVFAASVTPCLGNWTCGEVVTGIVPPLIKYFGYAIVAVLITPVLTFVAKPLMGEIIGACGPTAKDSFDLLLNDIRTITKSLKESIDDKGLSLFHSNSIDSDEILNEVLRKKMSKQESELKDELPKEVDEKVKQAQRYIDNGAEDGSYIKGIELYKEILKSHDKPGMRRLLLDAYSTVLEYEEAQGIGRTKLLKEAEGMLLEYGMPINYVTIAYNHWENKDLTNALKVAEQGLSRFAALEESDENYRYVMGLKNSLAYYLADSRDTAQKDRAFELIKEAISYWKKRLDSSEEERGLAQKSYANFLDTLGFVNIVYSESIEGLEKGYAQCQQAHKMGIEDKLFNRHKKAYHQKMAELLPED